MEIFLYFAAFLKVVRLVPTQNSISAKYQPIVQPWCLENKHKDTHMALSITSCHQQQIKTFTVTQRQEKSAGQKNLGGSREPRCGRVQGERWHASWVWGKTDDSQIAKMDLRLPIWRISSSLTDLLCLSVCLSVSTLLYKQLFIRDAIRLEKTKGFFFFQEGRCPGEICGNSKLTLCASYVCDFPTSIIALSCNALSVKGNAFSFDLFKCSAMWLCLENRNLAGYL